MAVVPEPTFRSAGLRVEETLDRLFQRSQLALDDVPDQRKIDAEILMRQDIASTSDSGPRNLRSLLGKAIGAEITDDLPDDFEIADHRILSLAVVHELLAPVRRVFADTLQTIREMP